MNSITIRPNLTMSKMGVKKPKADLPILDDTFGIAIKECLVNTKGDIDEGEDDIEFSGIYLTKAQCIILKNYLDTFTQLAETEEELAEKL